jgi:hypothetical protein
MTAAAITVRSIVWLGCIDDAPGFRVKLSSVLGGINGNRNFTAVSGVRNMVVMLFWVRRQVCRGVSQLLCFGGRQEQGDTRQHFFGVGIVNSHGKMWPNEN